MEEALKPNMNQTIKMELNVWISEGVILILHKAAEKNLLTQSFRLRYLWIPQWAKEKIAANSPGESKKKKEDETK